MHPTCVKISKILLFPYDIYTFEVVWSVGKSKIVIPTAVSFFRLSSSLWNESRRLYIVPGVANQSKTKSHISYCVTAKNHIIHMGALEHHPIFSSLSLIPLLS